jgi:hypothetical protein
MNNNLVMWRMVKDRHGELLGAAHSEHLCAKPKDVAEKKQVSRFDNVGSILVSLRLWMRARYQSVTQ